MSNKRTFAAQLPNPNGDVSSLLCRTSTQVLLPSTHIISPDRFCADRRAHNFQAWYHISNINSLRTSYSTLQSCQKFSQERWDLFIDVSILCYMFCYMISYITISHFHISCTGYRNQKVWYLLCKRWPKPRWQGNRNQTPIVQTSAYACFSLFMVLFLHRFLHLVCHRTSTTRG